MWFLGTATPVSMPRPRWVTISMILALIDPNPTAIEFSGLMLLNMVVWSGFLLVAGRVGRKIVGF